MTRLGSDSNTEVFEAGPLALPHKLADVTELPYILPVTGRPAPPLCVLFGKSD